MFIDELERIAALYELEIDKNGGLRRSPDYDDEKDSDADA